MTLTKMKEYPILFSGPMVQALLNTKPNTWPAEPIDPSKPFKSMTRRVAKPYCSINPCNIVNPMALDGTLRPNECVQKCGNIDHCFSKKRFSAGDRLWIRETFTKDPNGEYIYRADPMFDDCGKGDISWAWTSPLFLPHEAARIKLEVKNVRIERVQDIMEEDARAEGVKITAFCGTKPEFKNPVCAERNNSCYVCAFKDLWDTLNAKGGHSWDRNPWVLVVKFIRIR